MRALCAAFFYDKQFLLVGLLSRIRELSCSFTYFNVSTGSAYLITTRTEHDPETWILRLGVFECPNERKLLYGKLLCVISQIFVRR